MGPFMHNIYYGLVNIVVASNLVYTKIFLVKGVSSSKVSYTNIASRQNGATGATASTYWSCWHCSREDIPIDTRSFIGHNSVSSIISSGIAPCIAIYVSIVTAPRRTARATEYSLQQPLVTVLI